MTLTGNATLSMTAAVAITGLLVSAAIVPVMAMAGILALVSAAIVSVMTMAGQLASSVRPMPMPTGGMLSPVLAAGTPSMLAAVPTAMAATMSTASFGRTCPTDHDQRHHDPAQNDCNLTSHDCLPLFKKNVKTWATWYFLCAPPGGSSASRAG